ncbi:MAG: dihydrolipoamide acetyltransferase family protein, partial [Propionibacterium sp.]|nr:dihydrolipoamide acetyltransferase family protein [Propionibacterium sp.]
LPVGTVLARVTGPSPAGGTGRDAPPAGTARPAGAVEPPTVVLGPAPLARPEESRRRVTPAARKLARDLGVDLDRVVGTGPDGSVSMTDIERAHTEAGPSASGVEGQPMDMRAAIAAAMSRSKREIPHYYLAETIPMDAALDWLASANAGRPISDRLLAAVLQIKAVALALRDFPELNGFHRDGMFVPSPAVHVGVAISLRQAGLIAPAIHDVADKSLEQLMHDLTDLVRRARSGSVRSSEFSDPTITVTNLGEQGVETVFGVIHPPQVALVGFGRVVERPWVVDAAVSVARVVTASLSADHRVSDGGRGARFLRAVSELLQLPDELDAPGERSST